MENNLIYDIKNGAHFGKEYQKWYLNHFVDVLEEDVHVGELVMVVHHVGRRVVRRAAAAHLWRRLKMRKFQPIFKITTLTPKNG